MKLGNFEFAHSAFVFAGIFLVLAVIDISMWSSRRTRLTEAWHRDAIIRAMIDESGDAEDKGINEAKALIAKQPKHIGARFFLAAIYYKHNRFPEAEAVWDEIAKHDAATPDEKASALVGMAAAAFYKVPKEKRLEGAIAAESILRKAREISPTGDVLANLALVNSWKPGGIELPETEALIKGAQGASQQLSPKAAEQIHYLHGIALAPKHPADADLEIERAVVLRPGWREAEEAKRWTVLASIGQAGVDGPAHRESLDKILARINSFGEQKASVLNGLAMAWYDMKASPDYQTVALPKTITLLKQAMNECPKDKRAYGALSAIYEERIAAIGLTLVGKATGIIGETPAAGVVTLPGETVARHFPAEDLGKIKELKSILREAESVWQAYVDRAATDPTDKIDGKIHQASAIRRQAWLMDGPEASQRAPLQQRALEMVSQAVNLDDKNGLAHFTRGLVLLEKGDKTLAINEFNAARANGFESADLDRILASFGGTITITDIFPSPNTRQFALRPFVRANLLSGGAPINVALLFDGKEAKPDRIGSQIFYFPGEDELKGDQHSVRITATDTAGGTSAREFKFYVDMKAPTWTLAPDPASPVPGSTLWTVNVEDGADGSGVDFTSLTVGAHAVSGMAALDLGAIKDGRYRANLPRHKINAGDAVAGTPFRLGFKSDLPPGQYRMAIHVKDMAGNTLTDSKFFTVK